MIQNISGMIILGCDDCGFSPTDLGTREVIHFNTFFDASAYMKDVRNKWKCTKMRGEFKDLCPICAKKLLNWRK